ncbi:MAG TPA: choice-of-anchor Q domain-containing protein, partial [Candidatus Limnocylindrales bacterium]|nr:choice-of-anchor Q domain-containing protein [Candidatus Limnocylindrales bacterium]
FHTFAVEWQPDRITWLLDGSPFFTATPGDAFLEGKEWVFNHPFYMLLNVAVGGNFGGAVGADTTFPRETKVDYVRVYQTTPSLKSFVASFRDDFTGWRKVSVPFSAFRAADGSAPDLSRVISLAVKAPTGLAFPLRMDQVRLTCPISVTVTSSADSGAGSLRAALDTVCAGGTIEFAPALAGDTITNLSTLSIAKDVTIDGADAPGLSISGGGVFRVFEVAKTATATVSNLTLTDGYGFQLGGGVLNNGDLTLDHVVLTGNRMATNAGDFWQGGGGVYNGDGASLHLVDSTVSDNTAAWSGGGIYSFFNTTTTIERSTISGNTSNDVGGGIRSLGDMTITNSTISGNTSTGWHGGAIFHTDGDMTIESSTITGNRGPDYAPSAIFNGSFGGPVPTMTLTNTIISGNQWYACERFTGANTLTSGGHNLLQDDSCGPVATDLVGANPQLGALADNGGPTWTHALLAGSEAIDAAGEPGPGTDQRGIARPQGARPDIGAYEAQ